MAQVDCKIKNTLRTKQENRLGTFLAQKFKFGFWESFSSFW